MNEQLKSTSVSWSDYVRAERFLPWNAARLAFELDVEPHWIDGSDRFWYRSEQANGTWFFVVDSVTGDRHPVFDQVRLAAKLSRATGTAVEAGRLPLDEITLAEDGSVSFRFGTDMWRYEPESDSLSSSKVPEAAPGDVVRSPEGTWDAFVRGNDLWVRKVASGEEHALTTDGVDGFAYGSGLISPLATAGIADADPPSVVWSPDGSRLLTVRIDGRDALKFHLVQSVPKDGSIRPRLHTYAYPLPGDDATPRAELWVFDVSSRSGVKIDRDPIEMLYYGSPLSKDYVWWSRDGRRIHHLTRDRGYLTVRLHEVDAVSGASRDVLVETAERGIEPFLIWGSVNVRVFNDGREAIWYSQRDGWAHIYLYDLETGALKRQLTSGAWNVSELFGVDEESRTLYFGGVGREPGGDPYYTRIYRVGLDSGEPELLTSEDAEHGAIFSPSFRFFINTHSRSDMPPVTFLRGNDGSVITTIATANVEQLEALGWPMPERFVAKARDGVTDVYGLILRPTNFDLERSYPVIDNIYAGPQVNQTPTSFADSKRIGGATRAGRGKGFWHAQAIAELGFIVVMIDGIGMPARSRAFHDVTYRDLGDGGIADHISALRQLGDRYPQFDLDRVGIFGHSAGGYASAHAILTFPDFYKVCVSSAGNHDHRLDKASWVERYMGLPVGEHYREQANQTLAANLQGKLLLIHGEMDENVHPASTLVVVDALIQENKDFDLLIIPNLPHQSDTNPYFVRRRWDYFVRHLRGAEPPARYRISGP